MKTTAKNYKLINLFYYRVQTGGFICSAYERKTGKQIIDFENEWVVKQEIEKRGLKIVQKFYR